MLGVAARREARMAPERIAFIVTNVKPDRYTMFALVKVAQHGDSCLGVKESIFESHVV